jgi:flavin reductase (DIM6/NTAB) family NADH-FMN oxidoreductase RutF
VFICRNRLPSWSVRRFQGKAIQSCKIHRELIQDTAVAKPGPAGFRMSLNASDFRQAMGCFATGVTVITVDQDGEVHGMTANAFTAVSLDPVLVLVCVDHRARTHAHLHARKRFGVNVLRRDQQTISDYYARAAETHEHPEVSGARFNRTAQGTPVLEGALAYLECRLHSTQPAGDHTIFIAEVEQVVVRGGEPLLYFRSQYRDIEPVRH